MNLRWNCDITFWALFLFCVSICPTKTDAKPNKIDQIIVVGAGKNVTLLCNPSQNLTKSSQGSDFEWITGENDIPVFSNGKLSPFLFDLDVDNSSFAIDTNGTLIFRKVRTPMNSTFTCIFSTPSTKLTYTYLVQVNVHENYTGNEHSFNFRENIKLNEPGDQVILPCKIRDQQSATTDFSYAWLSRKFRPNTAEEVEVISLNRDILLKNNVKRFRIGEDGSLIIPSLIPTWRTYYECHGSNGQHITYVTTLNDYDKNDLRQSWIDRNIAVELGNEVSLKCHVGKPSKGTDIIWIRNNTELLFINERAVKNSKVDNLEVDYDNTLLKIINFSPSMSGTYTCRATNGENYRFKLEEKKGFKITTYAENHLGNTITLDCPTSSSSDSYFVWTRNNDELLFINGHTVSGSNVDKLKTEYDGRSLLISNFSYSLGGIYTCSVDTGINSTYYFIVPDKFSGKTSLEEKSFSVEYGTKNYILSCPSTNESANSSYEWFFSSPFALAPVDNLLSLNQLKFTLDYPLESKYYSISEDGFLLIKVMRQYQYGKYTCKRSTGEQFIYNLNREYKWINKTILVKRGETNDITLPCPVNDARDREYNIISWTLTLESVGIYGELRFVDGKILESMGMNHFSNNFSNNVKLADDKASLIISNITSSEIKSIGKDECICYLPYSGTVYKYSLTI